MGRGRWRRIERHRSSRSPLYKGVGARLGRPSRPIRPIEVTTGGAVDRPPLSIEGAWELSHMRATSRIPRACHSLCIMHAANVARRTGAMGRVERRFPGKDSK